MSGTDPGERTGMQHAARLGVPIPDVALPFCTQVWMIVCCLSWVKDSMHVLLVSGARALAVNTQVVRYHQETKSAD